MPVLRLHRTAPRLTGVESNGHSGIPTGLQTATAFLERSRRSGAAIEGKPEQHSAQSWHRPTEAVLRHRNAFSLSSSVPESLESSAGGTLVRVVFVGVGIVTGAIGASTGLSGGSERRSRVGGGACFARGFVLRGADFRRFDEVPYVSESSGDLDVLRLRLVFVERVGDGRENAAVRNVKRCKAKDEEWKHTSDTYLSTWNSRRRGRRALLRESHAHSTDIELQNAHDLQPRDVQENTYRSSIC